jgi:hypothetical protein
MELLDDEAQVDACFCPFGDSANLDARLVHGYALNIPHAQKLFWTHPIEHLGDVGHVESHFGPFRDSVSIGVNRCTVCAKRTVGSEIVLNALNGTPR